ncbi:MULTISPECIES: asparagine synthase-related protein [Campylobacter]|uniref:Asparagine synthase n=1 Tax=Campylobacter porcelli TaxID=1660073 RepID=A0A1X9SY19_9BACT|nr:MULTISPECIES: asparagine synthase C-terminal domain-containing protein [unclassified Campylobacter]ARR01158.1 asparagine synthase [Campylobacter sp. RM6137]MCR8697146.1 asparagine synthase C-terminal domain-containing protein [Campylobacter sp. RM19073]MEE3705553.1 asparagine synthase C-terminal domain-containing protein [Campylobacter sp. CX2-8023-23]MEE3745259.1 asparagine synthase C-terminal domain-containing protein [Campylobacter sp. CX2-4855-23]
MTDKLYCMSHYLAFRFIKDENINFFDGLNHTVFKPRDEKEITPVSTIDEMDRIIKDKISEFYVPNKTAILLSGGIDSAILASYLPKGTKAYTFKCIAPNAIDETAQAKKYCDIYGLDHEIIEMNWSDFEELTPEILKADGVPFHSIEVQLLKAAKHAKSQGIEKIIYGDAADYVFGGMDKILSKTWKFDEFVERYNSIEPSKVLKNSISVKEIYEPYRKSLDLIDFQAFLKDYMDIESYTSYMHAFELGGVEYLDPYSFMKMARPLNLNRVRNGEPKYMVRELFAKRYPNIETPTKIPMPRAMNQWLKEYIPTRSEFIENCAQDMTGDQKWLCWCLEQFLNMHDKGEL